MDGLEEFSRKQSTSSPLSQSFLSVHKRRGERWGNHLTSLRAQPRGCGREKYRSMLNTLAASGCSS